ncbi:response regulator [Fischerella thermalis]|nr:response regulator transcription factor [Fischerella thermalis]
MLMLSCESYSLRVLVVDDHELTRLTLQLIFSGQENIQVVGLACNGQEAIEMVKRHKPNVIVLDLQMPVMDGWIASGEIKAIDPSTQIIAYSSVDDSKLIEGKARACLDAICKKDVPTTELVSLVRQLGQRTINGTFAG